MSIVPNRSFPLAEFEDRHNKASKLMHHSSLDALLVTSEEHIRYFTGFISQFWASPTRPWFILIPKNRPIVAIIPDIGEVGMNDTWVKDIRTWPAPVPEDDGVSLLSETIRELVNPDARIGAELGHEMVLRMPILDFEKLRETIMPRKIVDATSALKTLRSIKSSAEIEKIRYVCGLVSDAFEGLPMKIKSGMTEREACRLFQSEMFSLGVDSTPYVMGVSGLGGYDNIIMGPSDRILHNGDIFIIDTGATFDGYFCDFDRNFSFGQPSDSVNMAYKLVYDATTAGIEMAKPGKLASDLWLSMAKVLESGGANVSPSGRMGHGLGLQLTEWPSNKIGDNTPLVPGMVMTIEPGIEFEPGLFMVHEENIVITSDGCEILTKRATPEIIRVD